MRNVYLFQPQTLTMTTGGTLKGWLPYSVARLWSYVSKFKNITDNYTLKKLVGIRLPFNDVLKNLDNPSICGFGAYVWNFNYSIELAKLIKEQWPNCQIVFGGPHVTPSILDKYSFIDSIVEGEGEFLFKTYLEDNLTNSTKRHYKKDRIKDLDVLASPYIDKLFDPLFEEYPDYLWSSTIETNRGCPYHCTFCDWGSLTNSKIYKFEIDVIEQEIEYILNRPKIIHISLADANFGIFKERDLEIAKQLQRLRTEGTVRILQASYTKTYHEYLYDIYKALGNNDWISISLQSNNKDTLNAIKRKNLSDEIVTDILNYTTDKQLVNEQEYILPLPLETKQSWYEGVTSVLDSGDYKFFSLHLCSFLPNTELATKESREKYGLQTVMTPEINIKGPRTHDDILEYSEIVKATNTMTTSELIDSFIFVLIVMHVHCAGYSHRAFLTAKKLYSVENLDFYTAIEHALYDDQVFSEHLNYIRGLLEELFNVGIISDPGFAKEGRFDYMSYPFFYKNKNRLHDIVMQVFKTTTNCADEIYNCVNQAQSLYIFDLTHSKEQEFSSLIDFNEYKFKKTKYTVSTNLNKKEFIDIWAEKGSGEFFNLQVSRKLINTFTVDQPKIISLTPVLN